jgi:hypothetical protein
MNSGGLPGGTNGVYEIHNLERGKVTVIWIFGRRLEFGKSRDLV